MGEQPWTLASTACNSCAWYLMERSQSASRPWGHVMRQVTKHDKSFKQRNRCLELYNALKYCFCHHRSRWNHGCHSEVLQQQDGCADLLFCFKTDQRGYHRGYEGCHQGRSSRHLTIGQTVAVAPRYSYASRNWLSFMYRGCNTYAFSDSGTHVVPNSLRGERQGDRLPSARTLFTS